MEWAEIFLLSFFLSASVVVLVLSGRRKGAATLLRLPPGPRGWPVFGCLFSLGPMPRRSLARMRDKYGPVIWLRFESRNTMVILSAEFFKIHDLHFADRKITELMLVHGYYRGSIALAPYGPCWRLLRKLVAVNRLVSKRLNETASIRRRCVNDMLRWVEEAAGVSALDRGVHISWHVFLING